MWKKDSVRLALRQGITTYTLDIKHSKVQGTETLANPLYIEDSLIHPFNGRVLAITQVFDNSGRRLNINVENDSKSVYVPQFNVVQVPMAGGGFQGLDEDYLVVEFNSFCKPLTSTTMAEAALEEFPLPDYMLDALYAYVGGILKEGVNMDAYNQEIQTLLDSFYSYVPPDVHYSTKLDDQGFV
jgi:hypothetical protein